MTAPRTPASVVTITTRQLCSSGAGAGAGASGVGAPVAGLVAGLAAALTAKVAERRAALRSDIHTQPKRSAHSAARITSA